MGVAQGKKVAMLVCHLPPSAHLIRCGEYPKGKNFEVKRLVIVLLRSNALPYRAVLDKD